MICKSGRPELTRDEERSLFSESAGTCLICCTTLFPGIPKRERSLSVAERAHIVSHSDDGPRSDPTIPSAARSDPENLVLLCPTCHTKVDKASDSYPAEELRRQKQARQQAVARIGGTAIYSSREEARHETTRLLNRNRLLFEQYGPNTEDGSLDSTEAAIAWTHRVLNEIIPNNQLLIALVEVNEDLTTWSDRRAAELLRQHTDDLERKHSDGVISGPAKRFPIEAESLFS